MAPESGAQEPRPPSCPPLHTLQSRGPAYSENKKGPFKIPTLWLVWGRHHPTCAWAALGLGPWSAAMSVGCARKCVGRRAAPRPLHAERPGTLSVRSALGPSLRPQTASGGRPRAAVPSAGSRTTPRSGGLSPGWTHSRPRQRACPVPQPPRSLRSSLRHLWDVGWKDDAGLRLRTPGSGPGSTSNYRSRPFMAPPGPRQRDARAR